MLMLLLKLLAGTVTAAPYDQVQARARVVLTAASTAAPDDRA